MMHDVWLIVGKDDRPVVIEWESSEEQAKAACRYYDSRPQFKDTTPHRPVKYTPATWKPKDAHE